jgi:hypothetical protein
VIAGVLHMKSSSQHLQSASSQLIECFVTEMELGWVTVLRRGSVEVSQLFDSEDEAQQKAAELRVTYRAANESTHLDNSFARHNSASDLFAPVKSEGGEGRPL